MQARIGPSSHYWPIEDLLSIIPYLWLIMVQPSTKEQLDHLWLWRQFATITAFYTQSKMQNTEANFPITASSCQLVSTFTKRWGLRVSMIGKFSSVSQKLTLIPQFARINLTSIAGKLHYTKLEPLWTCTETTFSQSFSLEIRDNCWSLRGNWYVDMALFSWNSALFTSERILPNHFCM